MNVLVSGAGGFIGYHLCQRLDGLGYTVHGIDIQSPAYGKPAGSFQRVDMRSKSFLSDCFRSIGRIDQFYHLAADMGGIGYIETNKCQIVTNNTQINLNALHLAERHQVGRFLFSSSACVYPSYAQDKPDAPPLREAQAYPADPEDGYGWEKLYMERLCRHFHEDRDLDVRIARFHNIYGPFGAYEGGREKSPAAICTKVCRAADDGEIEIWGDGEQRRSYCYVDDCVEGLIRLMASNYSKPLNIGTDTSVSINELVSVVEAIAKKGPLKRRYDLSKPQGVRGRNCDMSKMKQVLGWEPKTSLIDGMTATYAWISNQITAEPAKVLPFPS